MNCYCTSGVSFADCCEPFLEGREKPVTAEKLMRSRFSAYALARTDYLVRSTHPSTRRFYAPAELDVWARANTWEKLEIIAAHEGAAADKQGTVEFKAYYRDEKGAARVHHELSNFRKELGKWFFVDGIIKS